MYAIAVIIALYFYVRLGIWVAKKASASFEGNANKWSIRIAIALVFILIPTGDAIVGQIYFNHLCETEAGAKVYQTIELPAEYWDKEGKPRFMNTRGVWDAKMLGDRFEWKRESHSRINTFIKIDRETSIFFDNAGNRKLGEIVNFRRYFGWLNNFSPAPNTSESCPNIWKGELSQKNFMLGIFKPVNSLGKE